MKAFTAFAITLLSLTSAQAGEPCNLLLTHLNQAEYGEHLIPWMNQTFDLKLDEMKEAVANLLPAPEHNEAVLRLVESYRPGPGLSREYEVSTDKIQAVFDALVAHPVAGLDQLPEYDPKGDYGFCYGRATAAHLLALKMGVQKRSILKLWAVGEMKSFGKLARPDQGWRFHVVTVIRGEDGAWFALDPILSGPVPIADWVAKVVESSVDAEKIPHLFLTEAKRVDYNALIPNVTQATDRRERKYYRRLLNTIRGRPLRADETVWSKFRRFLVRD